MYHQNGPCHKILSESIFRLKSAIQESANFKQTKLWCLWPVIQKYNGSLTINVQNIIKLFNKIYSQQKRTYFCFIHYQYLEIAEWCGAGTWHLQVSQHFATNKISLIGQAFFMLWISVFVYLTSFRQ